MTQQPKWKLIANLGDSNPLDHDGIFVYVDTTGTYKPEIEFLYAPENDDDDNKQWELYRILMEDCTYEKGVLSDNPHHPDLKAWWANSLEDICSTCDVGMLELISQFCSNDPIERAHAWISLVSYFGPYEVSGREQPRTYTNRGHLYAKYRKIL